MPNSVSRLEVLLPFLIPAHQGMLMNAWRHFGGHSGRDDSDVSTAQRVSHPKANRLELRDSARTEAILKHSEVPALFFRKSYATVEF